MTTRPICESTGETAVNCLDIIERGLRRLGIKPGGRPSFGPLLFGSRVEHPRRKSRRLTGPNVAQIIELRRRGLTQAQIAAALKCAQGTVSKRLMRAGVVGTL